MRARRVNNLLSSDRKHIDVKDLHDENKIMLYLVYDIDSIQSDRASLRGNHLEWIFVE